MLWRLRALSAGSAAVRRCNANPYRVEANRSRLRSGLGDHAVSQEPKQAAHRDVRDELFALELGARGRRGVFSAEPLRDGLAWIWSKVVILGAFGGYRLEQVRQLLGSSWDPGVAGPIALAWELLPSCPEPRQARPEEAQEAAELGHCQEGPFDHAVIRS